jgi:O-antigen/teichoic acid export membrane protein
MLFASVYFFSTKYKLVSPSLSLYDTIVIKDILSLGTKFFLLQIITIVLFNINNILILQIVDGNAVVEYSIAYRYLDFLTIIFTIFITPVWSASIEAIEKNDIPWIKKTAMRMTTMAILISVIGIIMILLSEFIFAIWIGKNTIAVNRTTLLLVLAFMLCKMLYQSYGFIINAYGRLKAQMIITSITALAYVPSAIILGNNLGLYGILAVSFLSQLINFLWSYIQYNHLVNKTGSKLWHK